MPFRQPDRRLRRIALDERVFDAMVVARAGVRQRLKNVIIVHTLRDGADFELAWYTAAARDEFEQAAAETEADAERVARELAYAKGRHLRAVTARDYVDRDVPTMRLRRKVLIALGIRLHALARDERALEELIYEARRDALDDIATAAAAVPRPNGPRTVTGSARRIALSDLHEDLAELARERDES